MRALIVNAFQLALTLGSVWFGILFCGMAMYGGIATAWFLAILAQQIGLADEHERALGRDDERALSRSFGSVLIALWFGATWISLPPIFLYGTWKTRVDRD